MTKIKIVTDSSVTIEPELVKQLDITIVPLSVMIDNVVYSDADLKEEGKFLQLMQASKNLPKTSQPPVGVFAEVFEDLCKDGSQILAIHMSHALSGTVEAARQGASLSTANVTVIDSSFTDQALKFQVVEAAKLAQEGKDMEEILSHVEEVKKTYGALYWCFYSRKSSKRGTNWPCNWIVELTSQYPCCHANERP